MPVYAFDTLSYARHLKEHGVPDTQAEAHAEAARQFIMSELVTGTQFQTEIAAVRRDLDTTRRELEAKIDTMTLRLTVRLGMMLGGAVALLAALIKLA